MHTKSSYDRICAQSKRTTVQNRNRPPPTIEAEARDPDTDLDVSTAPPEKEEIIAAIRSLKNGKPREKTASTQSSSRQSQSLQTLQPLFAAIWEEKKTTGRLDGGCQVEINNWKVIILLSVPSKILKQWTSDSDRSKQVFEKDEFARTGYLLCATSSNRGRGYCASSTWILRRYSTLEDLILPMT